MTLGELLPLVSKNPKLNIKIMESDNTPVITFNAAGYGAISAELNARELDEIVISEIIHDEITFKLILKALPPEPDPEPEPEDPNEP